MAKPKIGDQVEIFSPYEDTWWPAEVVLLLSAQFVAESTSGRIGFGMYNGQGTTWKIKKSSTTT